MVYTTGDKHADWAGLLAWGKRMGLTKDDTVIVLGDAGLNFIMGWKDYKLRKKVSKAPWTTFVIRGNHDKDPCDSFRYLNGNGKAGKITMSDAHWEIYFDNLVLVEDNNPNIKYAMDGFIYTIEGQECLVIGGGYSVDKFYRLENGWTWIKNEQLDAEEMEAIYQTYLNNKVDVILSHVAPVSYEADIRHLWMSDSGIKGGWTCIDKSMEIWMNKLLWDEANDIKRWYFGHNHANLNCHDGVGVMLYEMVIPFGEKAAPIYADENDSRIKKS
jgi:hypothetical protein